MKIIKLLFILFLFSACSKKNSLNDRWKVDVSGIGSHVEITDISKDFYNTEISIPEFRKKYPFYLDPAFPDDNYEKQRRDTTELNIYSQIQQKINNNKLKNDLSNLFRHIKFYYPFFKEPKVYTYSSFVQNYLAPVSYNIPENTLFIATDCFLGYDNKYYNALEVEKYMQISMSYEYLLPKVAKTLITSLNIVPRESTSQSFVSQMIYQGKVLILLDAFLPEIKDEYKIGYTEDQLKWAKENEFQIWNYFIENKYVFSDDLKLGERFLSTAPFSKFYTEADNKSPGRIGSWIGWQIDRKFLIENPKISVEDFIKNPNGEEIFSKSRYKPQQLIE